MDILAMRPLRFLLLAWPIVFCMAAACSKSDSPSKKGLNGFETKADYTCVRDAEPVNGPPVPLIPTKGGPQYRATLYKTSFRYPFLARWDERGEQMQDAVWAVATHVIAKAGPGADKLSIETSVNQALGRTDVEVRPLTVPGHFLVGLFPGQEDFKNFGSSGQMLEQLAQVRQQLSGQAEIFPDYIYFPDRKPSDPKYKQQEDLKRIGAENAWEKQTGSLTVKVAVLDSGIDLQHPELKLNLDRGYDFYNNDPDPDDDFYHGTYCAGIIGARGDNKVGIAGVNWQVTLLPVKFIGKTGCGDTAGAIESVKFAMKSGAHVISASWGGLGNDSPLSDVIFEAGKQKGILFVASAGNRGINLDQGDYFPASFNLDNMIVVGNANDLDTRETSSGHGIEKVHLSAPGTSVLSTYPLDYSYFDPYKDGGGTSASTAFVAGAAALLKAEEPSFTYSQIKDRLIRTTRYMKGLQDASCSKGVLDLDRALRNYTKDYKGACP